MSQARFQRHRDGVLNHFLDEVAIELSQISAETGIRRLIVAGPGQAKRTFADRAPKAIQDNILAVEDADFTMGAQDDALARRFTDVAAQATRAQAMDDLRRLKRELRTGERAVTGVYDSIEAAVGGRIATLLVLQGRQEAAQKCEEHQTVFPPGRTCPTCENEGNTVDAINECIEFVIRQRGEVEFVDADPFLDSLGGVAALLRY